MPPSIVVVGIHVAPLSEQTRAPMLIEKAPFTVMAFPGLLEKTRAYRDAASRKAMCFDR